MTEGISQEAREAAAIVTPVTSIKMDIRKGLRDSDMRVQAMQSLIDSTIERCAAVAESSGPFTGCNPAYVGGYIATAIRQMKGSTNV